MAEEIKQESKRIKLETTAVDKATEIGKIVCNNFECSNDEDFEGGAFRPRDVSFTAFGWKYYLAMIREDVFHEDPGFINRGSVIPLAKSWQVYNTCPNDEAGAMFHKNIRYISAAFRDEEDYFKGIEGLDKKNMVVDVNGTRYFLVLHSKYSLRQRGRLVDGSRIVPLGLDVLLTDNE